MKHKSQVIDANPVTTHSDDQMTVIESFINNGKALLKIIMANRYLRMTMNPVIRSLFWFKSLMMPPLAPLPVRGKMRCHSKVKTSKTPDTFWPIFWVKHWLELLWIVQSILPQVSSWHRHHATKRKRTSSSPTWHAQVETCKHFLI